MAFSSFDRVGEGIQNASRYYDTVADMLADSSIEDGNICQTARYSTGHTVGDGSGNLYKYQSGSAATIDGGFVMPGIGGALSFTGTTFDGTAGTGRFEATDQTVIQACKYGCDNLADSWGRLQTCINVSRLGRQEIQLTAGVQYTISDSLIIGDWTGASWQTAFGVTITGGNRPVYQAPYTSNYATSIEPTFTDKPVFILQNVRDCIFKNFAIAGLCDFIARGEYSQTAAAIELESNFESAISPARENQFSPHCAIAIDPFSSEAAATGNEYPGLSAYYVPAGTSGSTRVTVDGMSFRGTGCGIVTDSTGTNNLGSEVYIRNSMFRALKYCISSGGSNARTLSFRECLMSGIYCVSATDQHGDKTGWPAKIINCSGSFNSRLFSIHSNDANALTLCENCDWEGLATLGKIGDLTSTGGGGSRSARFVGNRIAFDRTASPLDPCISIGNGSAEFISCSFYRTDSESAPITISIPGFPTVTGYDWEGGLANAKTSPVIFDSCRFALLSPASTSETVSIVDGDEDWVHFRNCSSYGNTGPQRWDRINGIGISDPKKLSASWATRTKFLNLATSVDFEDAKSAVIDNASQLSSMSMTAPETGKYDITILPGASVFFNDTSSSRLYGSSVLPAAATYPFAVSCWVYLPTSAVFSGNAGIVSVQDGSTFSKYFALCLTSSGDVRAERRNGGSVDATTFTSLMIAKDEWVHLCLEFTSATQLKAWRNGVLQSITDTSVALTGTEDDLGVGCVRNNSPTQFFEGRIQDVRYFNTAVSDEDILSMTNMSPGTESRRWKMKETSSPFAEVGGNVLHQLTGTNITFSTSEVVWPASVVWLNHPPIKTAGSTTLIYDGTSFYANGSATHRKETSDAIAYAANIDINFDSGNGDNKSVEPLTGNLTIDTLTATRVGDYRILLKSDSATLRTITWTPTINGIVPTSVNSTVNTVIELFWDGSSWHAIG